jgi:inhibitor of KinA sporulation pathway (predicted exonuclease)
MGTSKKRIRPQRMTSLSNECWDTLTEISEASGDEKMSRSRVIELLAQMVRDLTLDEPTLPLVNKLRAKLGKKPLKNKNRSYRDILAD